MLGHDRVPAHKTLLGNILLAIANPEEQFKNPALHLLLLPLDHDAFIDFLLLVHDLAQFPVLEDCQLAHHLVVLLGDLLVVHFL